MRARGAELKRMDKDRELPVVVRLICGGLAGGISQTGKSDTLDLILKLLHSVQLLQLWSPCIFSTNHNIASNEEYKGKTDLTK